MVDIPPKQCFCGRSASYPYCDGTHKIKKEKQRKPMIKPLGNLVLIEEIKVGEKTTATGLVIAGSSADNGPKKGKVVAIGDGEQNYRGEIIPVPEIVEGDTVLYPPYSGTDVEDSDGTKYILITSKNILAVIGDN